MKRIRIGVMGGASIAERLMIPAIQSLQNQFELVAIASRTKENAQKFSDLFNVEGIVGYDELLKRNDINAIYMPLPTGLHHEWIAKSIESNKHVLAEKSLSMDFNNAKKLVDFAKSKKLLLMENFMFRYHSQHKYVFSALENGEIGSFRLFRAQFGFPPLGENNFRYNMALGGGALLDAAAYTVRASLWFLGSEQTVESATLYFKNDVDLFGNATLLSSNGIISQLSFGFDNYYRCNYEIWGSKGNIIVERAFTPKPNDKPPILIERNGQSERLEMGMDNHFINILKEFYVSIYDNNHEKHFEDILSQSKVLTDIREKAIRITL